MYTTIPMLMTWARIVAIPLLVGVFFIPELSEVAQNTIAALMFVGFAVAGWGDG